MNWYYAESGNQRGPVTEDELDQLIAAETITLDTLVWREGMLNWLPLGQARPQPPPGGPLPSLRMAPPTQYDPADAPPASGVVCAECHQVFPVEDTIRYGASSVCAGCKPLFIQKLKEGKLHAAYAGEVGRYAGFWIRAGAKLIDGLVLGVLIAAPILVGLFAFGGSQSEEQMGMMVGFLQLFGLVGVILYNTLFVGRWGATLGKMACGLKVVNPQGEPITYLRAFGRAWGDQLSGMICYIGYIIAAFDDEKRALHDHICGTRVIRK